MATTDTLSSLPILSRVFYVANKYSIHAEHDCIRKVKNKKLLRKCTLILVCLGYDDNLKLCKSCDACQHIINKYKIKHTIIYYNST